MVAVLVLILSLSLNVGANELIESADIWTAVKRAETLSKKYGPSHVVFASDLDNTLLTTPQALGSEPWFNWQEGLLKGGLTDERIACDMPDLLHLFYIAIGLSQSSPVQPDQAKAIAHMQAAGIATMAITARGEAVASQTFRELTKNEIKFSKTSLSGSGFNIAHKPFDLKKLADSGLVPADVDKHKLTDPRPVLYQRGVLFSDGQNKGILLKTLFHKLGGDIKALVFWDNDKKNTQRVFDVFSDTKVEVVSIRAARMDGAIAEFIAGSKVQATNEYVLMRRLIDQAYQYPRPCVLPIDKRVNGNLKN